MSRNRPQSGKADSDKVWFEVLCSSGTTYRDWTNGVNVSKNQSDTGLAFVKTGTYSEAVSVSVGASELTHQSI